jgi:hypothetical protein
MRLTPAILLIILGSACGAPPLTFEKDVRPLMQQRCTSCHVEGGIAPFALTSYEQVVSMKDAIVLAVKNRTMPPWLAGRGCADYADDQSLTDAEIAMLEKWVNEGAVRGTPGSSSAQQSKLETSLPQVDLTLGKIGRASCRERVS